MASLEQKLLSDRLRQSHSDYLKQETELHRTIKEREVAAVRIEELQHRLQLIEEEYKVTQV